MQSSEKDPKIDQLLIELSTNRDNIRQKLSDLESFKDQVQKVFPTNLDFRNKFLVDDKLKIVTGFYSTLLNYMQELNRSTREEIEVRRKIVTGDDDQTETNIRDVIKQLKKEGLAIPSQPDVSLPKCDTVIDPKEQISNGLQLIPTEKQKQEGQVSNG
jgi:hypothetical protein